MTMSTVTNLTPTIPSATGPESEHGWGTAYFSECARPFRQSVSPAEMGDALYIGLEHIGEGTLSLIGEGNAREVTSAKTGFLDGDILFGKLRPYFRKVVRAPSHGICSTDIWVIRAAQGVDQGYLYYCMASDEFIKFATSGSEGTKMPRAIWEHVSRFKVRLPSLPQQRRIAGILGALDDKIDLNRRMNDTLDQMAHALYKSWFVDFGPVRAKMDGHWHKGESLLGLPAELYGLFPDSLVPSELGEIPEGWKVKTLGELCDKPQYGYTASAQSEPVGPKFLRITDINKRPWIEWANVPHCVASEQECEKFRVRKGDVLITRMADPGHGVMVEEDLDAVFASYLIRFRPRNAAHGRLLQYWLKSSGYWEVVHGRGAGTTRTSLNARVLSGFPLLVPSDPVAKRFSDAVHAMRNRVVANTAETETLTTQRDALLPRLVSGMLRVSETNIMEPV